MTASQLEQEENRTFSQSSEIFIFLPTPKDYLKQLTVCAAF